MPGPSRCYLTPKDYSILEGILDAASTHRDERLRRMLRHKLAAATLVFPSDIDPAVARIGSRVEFSLDGCAGGNRILVHDDGSGLSGLGLPVTTPHGLALLGMREGDAVAIETHDGAMQDLRLDRIWSQPEAVGGAPRERYSASAAPQPAGGGSVVALAARRPPVRAGRPIPGDDDPGPAAA